MKSHVPQSGAPGAAWIGGRGPPEAESDPGGPAEIDWSMERAVKAGRPAPRYGVGSKGLVFTARWSPPGILQFSALKGTC